MFYSEGTSDPATNPLKSQNTSILNDVCYELTITDFHRCQSASASDEKSNESPTRKKARFSWQVKNRNVTGMKNGCSNSKNVCEAREKDSSWEAENFVSSSSRHPDALQNYRKMHYKSVECSEMNDSLKSHLQSASSSKTREKSDVKTVRLPNVDEDINEKKSYHTSDLTESGFSNTVDIIPQSNIITIVVPWLAKSNDQSHECSPELLSTNTTSVENCVARSANPSEPVRYVTMPMGKWLIEYSLMRAELDNDINKALERLRRTLPNALLTTEHHSYASERASLENAGIFEVIEQRGLRRSSESSFHDNSTPKPRCKSPLSQFKSTKTSLTAVADDDITLLLRTVHESKFDGCVGENKPCLRRSSSEDSVMKKQTIRTSNLENKIVNNSKTYSDELSLSSSATPSSSFIIDQALSAVICEKGIHL